MKVAVLDNNINLKHRTGQTIKRILNQLCGLAQQVAFLQRSRYGPRIMVAGVELTGVHVLQGLPQPKGVSPYHIGGCGFLPEESLIRSIGETLERYAQLVSSVSGQQTIKFASWDEMAKHGGRLIPLEALQLFNPEQYRKPEFPFHPVTPTMPLAWVKGASLIHHESVWIPAQLALVGYAAKNALGEERIGPAVTTGTAAHVETNLALRNAIQEIVQVDTATGFWYSSMKAHRIQFDRRTDSIQRLIDEHFHPMGPTIEFYWLRNPDLPDFTIACVMRERNGQFPAIVVGLGIDFKLTRAMYKALLETTGTFGLSKMTLLETTADTETNQWKALDVDTAKILDLDFNLLYRAFEEGAAGVEAKFGSSDLIDASEMPPDLILNSEEEVQYLIQSFQKTQKELISLDLSIPEIKEFGFTAVRVWSPDTLSLPLPSMPALNHPRYKDYGGALDNGVHPYA